MTITNATPSRKLMTNSRSKIKDNASVLEKVTCNFKWDLSNDTTSSQKKSRWTFPLNTRYVVNTYSSWNQVN
jgi:hypothetical protein